VVVVHPARRLAAAGAAGIAHRVVEDHHPRRAELVRQQPLDLRVVDALDLGGIVEITHGARRAYEGKTVAVEGEVGLAAARVLDLEVVRIVDAVPFALARRRFADIADRLLVAALQVVERGGDGVGGGIEGTGNPPAGTTTIVARTSGRAPPGSNDKTSSHW
jgi:hypothetical protein